MPTGAMPQATKIEVCLDKAEAARLVPRRRQMAGSNAVVHAAPPISLAEDAQQIDSGLTITGIRRIGECRCIPASLGPRSGEKLDDISVDQRAADQRRYRGRRGRG